MPEPTPDMPPRLRRWARYPYLMARRVLARLVYERGVPIDTARPISLGELGVAAPGRNDYGPSQWRALRWVLRPSEVTSRDVFLDVGCGTGRIVIQAARFPFRRVVGIEVSDQLTEMARRAVAATANLRCPDIDLVTADALEYEIPPDVTVIYFFNSFGGELFARFVDRLLESIDRHPRRVRFIYGNPVERERLEATGRVRHLRTARNGRSVMFEIEPAA